MKPSSLLLLISILVIALTSGALWLKHAVSTGEPAGVSASGKAEIGGDFRLIDQHGRTVTSSQFRGRLMLVFFGFSHCPDVCPLGLLNMTRALELIPAQADRIVPIFITIDPARDTPEQLKIFAQNFHPSLVALTGAEEAIKQVEKSYKVYSEKRDEHADGNYTMNHSGFIYLMDRDGKYLAHFLHNVEPTTLVDALKPHLD